MKIAHKVGLAAAGVLFLTTSLLSLAQVNQVRSTLRSQVEASISESSNALARQIENWLNAKLKLIDLMADSIDSNYSPEEVQRLVDAPMLKNEFILVFGSLEADGKPIKNSDDWQPAANWDGRQRPWYATGKAASTALLTEPYVDSTSGEILISAVGQIRNGGQFLGAFGGDIRLKTIADAVNNLDFNGAGYAFLLSRNGNIISHPDSELNGKAYSALFDGKSPALNKDLQELRGGDKDLLVSFTPLPNLKGMDWYIGVVLDKSIVMAEADALSWRAVIGTVLGVIISLIVLGVLMNSLLRPLDHLSASLKEVNSGEGDLTRRLPATGNDEISLVSHEFNRFLQSLQTLISEVMGSSHQVRDSTALTSSEADQAAGRLQEQLQELDQLATAMQEMASTAEEVARNAQAAAQAAIAANEETENGVRVVSRSTAAIKRLADEMDDTGQAINELAKLSQNIESILSVITSIADQTNLLALNAAIEAARAGEMGRGFAVVADEVRRLAEKSRSSADEIGSDISALAKEMVVVAKMIERQSEEVSSLTGVLETIEGYSTQTAETAGHTREVADTLQGLTAVST